MAKFSLDGKFINDKNLELLYGFSKLDKIQNYYLSDILRTLKTDDEFSFYRRINLFDENLNKLEDSIFEDKILVDDFLKHAPSDEKFFTPIYTLGNSTVVSSVIHENYIFESYDIEKHEKTNVKMEIPKTKFTKIERDYIKKHLKETFEEHNFDLLYKDKYFFTNFIMDKKNDLLWVQRTMDFEKSSYTFDIFKDGIYQNSFEFAVDQETYEPLRKNSVFYINNEKLYYYDSVLNTITSYKIYYKGI